MTGEIRDYKNPRFAFGKNWSSFLSLITEERIHLAQQSLNSSLEVADLNGKSFLDAGSGSGLFSLAARKLGARVSSFDYDPQSVACATELRRRYFPEDPQWSVKQGSVLDMPFLETLGAFDIVYSWGVLHHTGFLWKAMENVMKCVAPGGVLFLAIYNDQGGWSRFWRAIKKTYNQLPDFLRVPYAVLIMGIREIKTATFALLTFRVRRYFRNWKEPGTRGMNRRHDLVDWVGGYPFEVATPKEVMEFSEQHGFQLRRLNSCGSGSGCNEFVFVRRLELQT